MDDSNTSVTKKPEPKASAYQQAGAGAAAPPAAEPRAPMFMLTKDFAPMEQHCTVWHGICAAEVTIEDVLRPDFEKHLINFVTNGRVKVHDIITYDHVEHKYRVTKYVTDVDRETGRISWVLDGLIDRREQLQISDNLKNATVEQRAGLWTVELDKRVLKGGFETKLRADAWLDMKRNPPRRS